MAPMDAITSGTLTAARLLGVEDRLGSLENGKAADLIAVDGNPLSDIGILSQPGNVLFVAQSGNVRKSLL
jgi:imidazolonepropionase-like amidohydrolase